jgi:hypothetical protein
VLKHYTSYNDIQGKTNGQNKKEQPGKQEDKSLISKVKGQHAKKIIEETAASKPKFVKAEIVVDHVMSKRKSAVVPLPPSKPKDD